MSTSNNKQLDIHFEDPTPQKWSVPLKEDVFVSFMAKGNPTVHKVFADGSLFSPFLFRKYFDPSDAFPLWDFDSNVLLSNLCKNHNRVQSSVNWFQTDTDYILKAELPGVEKKNVRVYVENGKVLEISGEWKNKKDSSMTKDWRSGEWWEYGYGRRLELPENSDWRKIEAYVNNDVHLEIRIPKNLTDCRVSQASEGVVKESESGLRRDG